MKTAINILEQALEAKQEELNKAVAIRPTILEGFKIENVDTEGDYYAEKYSNHLKLINALENKVKELTKAIKVLKRFEL
ncbi:MAG: hypothetical protein SNI32_06270 [Rikenellaceae bacterium]